MKPARWYHGSHVRILELGTKPDLQSWTATVNGDPTQALLTAVPPLRTDGRGLYDFRPSVRPIELNMGTGVSDCS